MVPIDLKYKILASQRATGKQYTSRDGFLFLARDPAVPDTLRFYRRKCEELGVFYMWFVCVCVCVICMLYVDCVW